MRPQRASHGSKGPRYAGRAGVFSRKPLRLFFDGRIPRGSHRQWHREGGAVTVNDIEAKKNGDVQARFLDGNVLQAVDLFDIHQPENRTSFTLGD